MKKVLIALGSVIILAFTGCGGANGVQSGSEVAAVVSSNNSESSVASGALSGTTVDTASVGQADESGVSTGALIADQIASQAKFLGQPVSGIN